MSHLITNKLRINDLDILKKVIDADCRFKWKSNVKTFKTYQHGEELNRAISTIGTLEHAIRINGCEYEVGVVRNKDGNGWSLMFDPFDQAAEKIVGRECETLMVMYGETYVRDYAERNGFILEQQMDGDDLILTMTSVS
jgi:hypothetical protein